MIDDSRKDKCEHVKGELFAGGLAMIWAGGDEFEKFKGKMVRLLELDAFGWWETIDRVGDMIIVHPDFLIPISDKEFDDGQSGVDELNYTKEFGL